MIIVMTSVWTGGTYREGKGIYMWGKNKDIYDGKGVI